jgi:hypothetical protein
MKKTVIFSQEKQVEQKKTFKYFTVLMIETIQRNVPTYPISEGAS